MDCHVAQRLTVNGKLVADRAPHISVQPYDIDERLQRLDPQTAAHVERVVREILALTEPVAQGRSPSVARGQGQGLAALASLAEPMGRLTNAALQVL